MVQHKHTSDEGPGGRDRRGGTKGDAKEAAILDTAWRLLGEKPMASITVSDLARGAGLSRPTFYFYFDSREDVIKKLAARTTETLRGVVAGFPAGAESPTEVIRMRLAAYVARWREEGPVLRAMSALADDNPEMQAFWESITTELFDIAAKEIDRERRAGRALPGPPSAKDLAHALGAMQWRAAYENSLTPPSKDRDRRLVETLTAVFVRSIYGTA